MLGAGGAGPRASTAYDRAVTDGPRPAKRPITIYEVAKRAGVSPSTVSRVFSGVKVSSHLVPPVRQAAEELGFTPNRAARALRTRTSEVVGLIVADIENPFFTALSVGAEDALQSAGYSVLLGNTAELPDKERSYLDVALSQRLAGVIITPATDHTDVSDLLAHGVPLVTVDRALPGAPVDSVVVDNTDGGRRATQTLIQRGFQRIACIVGPSSTQTADDRARGWLDAMRTHDPRFDASDLLVHGSPKLSGGREAFARLMNLPEPPDAVFIGHNLMAIGALDEMMPTGRTPETFGVAVFGDLPFSGLVPHGLHLITLPARELGSTAARLLLERIGGDTQPPRQVVIPSPDPVRL
jgi:LacI family transcriptional regulator